MTKESSNLNATPAVKLLKDQVSRIEKTLKSLHGIGSQIHALDRRYVKGANVKPVKIRTSKLSRYAHSTFSAAGIFSSFVKLVGAAGKDTGFLSAGDSADGLSGLNFPGMSQGQIWSQTASLISRAMKRGL